MYHGRLFWNRGVYQGKEEVIVEVLSDSYQNHSQSNTVFVQQIKVDRVGGFEPTTSATATSQERQLLK